MVAGDVHWLFELMGFAPSARLILAAGGMIKPAANAWLQIGSYIEQQATHHAAQVEIIAGSRRLVAQSGCVSLPLHSFPRGPAAEDRFNLVEAMFASREKLFPF